MLIALLAAPADAGTAIGHPDIHHAVGTGLTFDTFQVAVVAVRLRRCNGQLVTVEVGATLSEGDPLELPTGCFDRMRVETAWLEATGSGNGGTFELDLAPGEVDVTLEGPFDIPGTLASVLELASTDWVTATMLNLSPGVHRHVEEGHPLYEPLSAAVRDDSTLSW